MMHRPTLESQNSFERLQQLVKKEGKSARNLVAWSVPAVQARQSSGSSSGRGKVGARRRSPAASAKELSRSEKMCVAAAGHYSKSRSSLGGKDGGRPSNRADVHARYWSYLFDNLFRAVDEIYRTCEVDGSVIECQEVMMTLNACHRDFSALIHRIEMERELEIFPQMRPPGVAWEVRKTSSPSKPPRDRSRPPSRPVVQDPPRPPSRPAVQDPPRPPSRSVVQDPPCPPSRPAVQDPPRPPSRPAVQYPPRPPSRPVVRSLDMGNVGLSWADRVRGRSATAVIDKPHLPEQMKTVRDRLIDNEKSEGEMTHIDGEVEVEGDGGEVEGNSGEVGVEGDGGEVEGDGGEVEHNGGKVMEGDSGEVEGDGGAVEGDGGAVEGDGGVVGDGGEVEGDRGEVGVEGDGEEVKGDGGEVEGDGGEVEGDGEEGWNQLLRDYAESAGHRCVSWAERCESPTGGDGEVPPMLLAETPRSPGRAITLHQRLSSPSRRRPIEESKRKLEEKQVKAQLVRERLVQEQKLRSEAEQKKVREARETRESRTRAWREGMEERLLKAELLRESHLQEKRRKAQDEDAKVSEIAFINTLEAQNRKIQVLRRHQDHEARLADMAEERARRKEETTAREEAAQERRRILEEERMAKLRDLDERRRDQVAKIEQMMHERERAREEAAHEKARERERRLEARNTALHLSTVELEKRIQSKHDESSRRYDQQLEQIKEKAAGSRHTSCEEAPCVTPYPHCKWCTLCNVPIISDVYLQSHERGRRHQEAVSRLSENHTTLIITLDEGSHEVGNGSKVTSEQLRAGRKRAKKLRQRMAARWREQEANRCDAPGTHSDHKPRLQRCVKEVSRLSERCSGKDGLEKAQLQQLDRNLIELARILGGKVTNDQLCFQELGGVAMVTNLLGSYSGSGRRNLPARTVLHAVAVLQAACAGHTHTCVYITASNQFSTLVDLLGPLLTQTSDDTDPELCAALMTLLGNIISTLSLSSSPPPSLSLALTDSISYLVTVGIVTSISNRFNGVSGPVCQPAQTQLVISAANLLVAISAALHSRVEDVFCKKRDDPTSLTSVLQETELVGLLRLLYAMLLHDGPLRHFSSPPPLPPHILSISTACLKAINNFAILNLHIVQGCLGAEGISLEFRHVASYLMWHCTYHHHSELLQEVILAVGYFSVLHLDNQVFLQSGRSPTLLQLLCNLPFEYFSNPRLSGLLFPTLLSACYLSHENRAILSQEISCQLLVAFLSSHLSLLNKPVSGPRNLLDLPYRFPQSCWLEAVHFFSHS